MAYGVADFIQMYNNMNLSICLDELDHYQKSQKQKLGNKTKNLKKSSFPWIKLLSLGLILSQNVDLIKQYFLNKWINKELLISPECQLLWEDSADHVLVKELT